MPEDNPTLNVHTYTLVEDDSGCDHAFLVGPQSKHGDRLFGHCDSCRLEVAVEVDAAGERTGRSWLVEYPAENRAKAQPVDPRDKHITKNQ